MDNFMDRDRDLLDPIRQKEADDLHDVEGIAW